MIQSLERFVPVIVDRDATPKIPRRFSVSGYPSLLVLGPEEENIHRFSGFRSTQFLLEQFDKAIDKLKLYHEGKPWLERPELSEKFGPGKQSSRVLGSQARVRSMVRLDDELWILQPPSIVVQDLDSGETIRESKLPKGLFNGIASDDKHIYLLPYGWTRGEPILVLHPRSGEVIREVVTEENRGGRGSSAYGLTYGRGRLYVAHAGSKISVVDPETGTIEHSFRLSFPENSVLGVSDLAFDDKELWALIRVRARPTKNQVAYDLPIRHVALVVSPKGKADRHFALERPASALEIDGRRLILADDEIRDFDEDHRKVRVAPEELAVHFWTPKRRRR